MGVLSEAYKDHHVKKNSLVVPIDFGSIKDVPESHAWPEEISSKMKKNNNEDDQVAELSNSIPVIDLNDPNVMEKILNACKTWGFVQVINHGVSTALIEAVEAESKRLFDLPMEVKTKVLRASNGAVGYGSPRTAEFFERQMWHEGFTIMGNSSIDHAKQLWPQDYQGFCDVMEAYQSQMKDLASKLSELILKSLSVPESEMSWFKQDPNNELPSALQLNSYPPCPDPTRTMGLGIHTDSMFLTILCQCGTNGLQVLKDKSEWVPVNPVPGALVVNVGDMLHIVSNGRIPSVLHRAVVNQKHRLSLAYFFAPPLDFQLSPFVDYPGCDGPKFKSMKVQEYVIIKAKLFNDALSSIRV